MHNIKSDTEKIIALHRAMSEFFTQSLILSVQMYEQNNCQTIAFIQNILVHTQPQDRHRKSGLCQTWPQYDDRPKFYYSFYFINHMVTLTPNPRTLVGSTSLLLDVLLETGNIPFDGFAIELLFRTDCVQVNDICISDTLNDCTSIKKIIDNENGQLLVCCTPLHPCTAGINGIVIATLCIETTTAFKAPFSVGERTKLYIHG